MKSLEDDYEPSNGRGTTPHSRRILLNTVCHLGMLVQKHYRCKNLSSSKPVDMSLKKLVNKPKQFVCQNHSSENGGFEPHVMQLLCEATIDLSCMPDDTLIEMTKSASIGVQNLAASALERIVAAGSMGYEVRSVEFSAKEWWFQMSHAMTF